jgi:hypothetical protein
LISAPADSTAPSRIQSVQVATDALIDSLKRKSCQTVAAPQKYPQAVTETLIETWCQLQRELGSVRSVERLGVRLPGWSDRRAFNYVRVTFDRGQRVMTWLFDNQDFIEMWQSETVKYPQSYVATEEAPGVLLLFDWFRKSSRRLVVETVERRLRLAGQVDGAWVQARLRSRKD